MSVTLFVVMLSVVMLNVVAPLNPCQMTRQYIRIVQFLCLAQFWSGQLYLAARTLMLKTNVLCT
jgi:hypothetical protein